MQGLRTYNAGKQIPNEIREKYQRERSNPVECEDDNTNAIKEILRQNSNIFYRKSDSILRTTYQIFWNNLFRKSIIHIYKYITIAK